MKRIVLAKFEIDDDPYVDHLPEYQRPYEKYRTEMRAKKILELVTKEACEFFIRTLIFW